MNWLGKPDCNLLRYVNHSNSNVNKTNLTVLEHFFISKPLSTLILRRTNLLCGMFKPILVMTIKLSSFDEKRRFCGYFVACLSIWSSVIIGFLRHISQEPSGSFNPSLSRTFRKVKHSGQVAVQTGCCTISSSWFCSSIPLGFQPALEYCWYDYRCPKWKVS